MHFSSGTCSRRSKEEYVRRFLVAGSIIAFSPMFAGCHQSLSDNASVSVVDGRWSDANVSDLKKAVDRRATHGLDHLPFIVDTNDPAGLTKIALRYATALAQGAADPTKLYKAYTLPRPKPDLRSGLAKAMADGDVFDWLEGLAPQTENYRGLSQAYLALGKRAGGSEPAIPPVSKPIRPGEVDNRIPAIAGALVASDYLDSAQGQGDRYNAAMVKAMKRMQANFGIDPDGEIGARTLETLNLSDADKARALAVAMERERWLERHPPATRIDVNLATARLTYWRDGEVADVRKVVVGEPDTETPQLGSPMYRLVANPTWTVPRSIEQKELAAKGAAYLRQNNMARKNGWIIQQPGPKNSLGLVKFDMKNDHQIYLHDTPAKQLFAEIQRQRSHGCVRVENALGFAEMIARDEGIVDQWIKARASGKESYVPLPREIPVRLFYQTILFDDEGQPVYRADPYGWNVPVSLALGFKAGSGTRLQPSGSDVGP